MSVVRVEPPEGTTVVTVLAPEGIDDVSEEITGAIPGMMRRVVETIQRADHRILSAIGLGGVFLRLRAELNWSRLFQDLVADFDETVLANRQQAALTEAGVPPAA